MPDQIPINQSMRRPWLARPTAALAVLSLLAGCDTRGAATSEAIARAEAAAFRAEAAQKKAEAAARSAASAPAPEVAEADNSDPSVTPYVPDPNEPQENPQITIDN